MSKISITVFTATYNRADTLQRVRDSLLRQTLDPTRFEWIVVDDGSTDGTRDLVQSWTDAPFAIHYSWQENSGKHIAWNRAVAAARGELFTVIDSDDACVPHALERFVSAWASLPEGGRRALAGVIARCQTPDGVPIDPPLPRQQTGDFAELAFLRRLPHDTWITMRTDVLRSNPFPELRARLVPEGALWHKIARTHRWLLHDECLLVYFRASHGRSDQLSRVLPWRYPAGMAFMQKALLDHSWRFFWRVPVQFLRAAVHFDRFSLHAGLPIGREISGLEHVPARALCWSVLPLAYAVYNVDRRRERA